MGELIEIELFDGKIAKLLKASGYNDEYYWDMSAIIDVDGKEFHICEAGSYSGYISHYESVRLNEAFKLTGVTQTEIDTQDFYVNDEWKEMVKDLYKRFIKSGAKEDYEWAEDNDDGYSSYNECMVDHEIVKLEGDMDENDNNG